METAVLIPAYKPDEKLVELCKKIIFEKMKVIVVNDGSGYEFEDIFNEIKNLDCILIEHEENFGKGTALKTGIKYALENNITKLVTADADGQHSVEDIISVSKELENNAETIILGSRNIKEMPLRSRFGNSLTKFLFSFLRGIKINDTQTGLRGIPVVKEWLILEGDRYEYEMNMLIFSKHIKIELKEIPISTIYINENESSHFKPIKDGLKIYKILFKRKAW